MKNQRPFPRFSNFFGGFNEVGIEFALRTAGELSFALRSRFHNQHEIGGVPLRERQDRSNPQALCKALNRSPDDKAGIIGQY